MLTRTRLGTYVAFLVALAVWLGGGVFDTIATHPAWLADPAAYVRATQTPQGAAARAVNPWPFTTAALALTTLLTLALFARYRGAGRREVLGAAAAVLAILAATGVYFVPTLGRLADAARSDAELVALSRPWIYLNLLRQVALLALFVWALVGLRRLAPVAGPGAARGDGAPSR